MERRKKKLAVDGAAEAAAAQTQHANDLLFAFLKIKIEKRRKITQLKVFLPSAIHSFILQLPLIFFLLLLF